MLTITTKYPVLISTNKTSNQVLLCTAAAIIMAISANVSIPAYPVPFTLQSMVVLLIGAMLGRTLGVLAIVETFALGLLGFPVFSKFSNSYVALASPTVGYIIGFFFSAYIAGWAAEKGYDRKWLSSLVLFAIAHQIIFVFGVAYLAILLGDIKQAFTVGYLPFIGWDIAKFTAAAIIMNLAWQQKSKTDQSNVSSNKTD